MDQETGIKTISFTITPAKSLAVQSLILWKDDLGEGKRKKIPLLILQKTILLWKLHFRKVAKDISYQIEHLKETGKIIMKIS